LTTEEKEIAALQRLGLTEYESRLYLSLIRQGPTKASQLSFFGQVPRTKAYGAIKELQQKGLLRIIPGKPELYEASSPNEVLFPLISKINNEIKDCEDVVQSLAVTFETSKYAKRDAPKQSEEFWRMDGRQAIYNKLNQAMLDASKSINYSTSETGLIRAYKAHAEAFERAQRRGATVRLLSPITPSNSTLAKEFSEIVELKTTERPLAHFVSIDSNQLIVLDSMPDDANTRVGHDVAIWTTSTLLVDLFERLFSEVWLSIPKVPLKEARAR
jgi:HTH-type transcriptional regulator, sugar sensing transcriptional regulator